jgi:hypothetical protein
MFSLDLTPKPGKSRFFANLYHYAHALKRQFFDGNHSVRCDVSPTMMKQGRKKIGWFPRDAGENIFSRPISKLSLCRFVRVLQNSQFNCGNRSMCAAEYGYIPVAI